LLKSDSHGLSVIVVWEHVLLTDHGPPDESVLQHLASPSVTELWDPGEVVSTAMMASAPSAPSAPSDAGDTSALPVDNRRGRHVVWDYVALFPPGVRWEDAARGRRFQGSPVDESLDGLRAALAAL
jgi:hypothetical protein